MRLFATRPHSRVAKRRKQSRPWRESRHPPRLEKSIGGTVLLVMNGRSLTGILADARRAFGDRPAVVITRNDDQIPVPEELLAIKAGEFKPDPGEYVLVANGGTSAQLVPVLLELERSHGAKYRVVDLQRDRIVELARSLVTEEDHLRAKDDVTESCGEVADVPEPERDDWTGSVPASLCG